MIVLIALEVFLLLVLVWVIMIFVNVLFRGYAPFVISRQKALDSVLNTIKPVQNQVIYELGSGSAKFLRMAQKRFPNVKLVGLEYSFVPFVISRLVLWLQNSSIEIHRQNMFKADLQKADFIYCYLLPSMMPKIGEKVRSECKSGTMLISYMFSIHNWEPKQIIKQDNGTIYFYEV